MDKKKKVEKIFNNCAVISDFTQQKVHASLQTYMGYCLYKTSQKLRFRINEILKDFNLVAPHLGILTIIDASEPMSQMALGDEIGVDKATMVKLLDGLEENGFIERVSDTKDRRVKFIKITKQGKKFTEKMNIKRVEVEKKFLSVLTAEEEKMLRRIMPKLLEIQ